MYNAFFEFEKTPFAARPDLAFFYRSESHDAALRSLSFAVQARMGLASLTGEPGTGKTILLECLRDSLEAVQIQCAFVRDSRISTGRLYQTIASELDLRCQGASADQVTSALNEFAIGQAKKGRTVALIVDQAHNLPVDVLDQILHLTSQHDNKVKLLQTILAGNLELNPTLDSLNLEPLKQQTVLSCGLERFTARETQDYIEFRLAQAGMREQTFFSTGVMAEIYNRSRGFAPAINSLCDGLLSAAFLVESRICTQDILDQVLNAEPSELVQPATIAANVAAATTMDLTLLGSLSEPEPPAMKISLLRLIFDILPSLPTHFAVRGNGLSELQLTLGPKLPAVASMLPATGLAAGSNKLMPIVPKRKQRIRRKTLAAVPCQSIQPVDFPSIAVVPSQSNRAGFAPKSVTSLVSLAQIGQPVSGSYGFVIPEAVAEQIPASRGPLHPAMASEVAGGPVVCEQGNLVSFAWTVSPAAPPAWNSSKTRLTALHSLQPCGPESKLQPARSRVILQQPTWTPQQTATPTSDFVGAKKAFSFPTKWVSAAAVTILAGAALYAGSSALGSTGNVLSHGWQSVHEALVDRAAVELNEDFRTGLDNWTSRGSGHPSWNSDASGFVHPAALALYRPSLGLADYQMQFVGTIDKKSLSWVVRAADVNNYYAIGLTVLKPGATPTIGVTRYAVINGKVQDRVTTPLVISARVDTVYHVSLDVQGDQFALSVQDQVVDTWSDARLRHGGIGFFAEPEAASRLTGVQVRSRYDLLGRLCAFLMPSGSAADQASLNERASITE